MMKTKTALVIFATILCILGCANSAERRGGKADLEVNSDRIAKDMAMCISDTWEDGSLGTTYPIAMRPIANGYTISLATYPSVFADVKETPNGSFTRMFSDMWSEAFLNDVKKCASAK